jgi:uncharacterized protein YbjT (DUF2867 family)
MNKKILVTGATGNLGSEVVRQLIEKGEDVRAAVRNPQKAREMDLKSVILVHWDYKRVQTFTAALENVERVVLIAPSGISNPDELINPAINAAKKAGLKHIVLVTAMGVDLNPNHPLQKAEANLKECGIDATIVRPNWFNQNFTSWMATTIKDGGISLPAGEGETSFIDTRDIAAVICKIFADKIHRNKEYTLTGNAALNHAEVASTISRATGKKVDYHDLPMEDFKVGLRSAGYSESVADFMAMIYTYVRDGHTAHVSDSVAKIIGRDPISFEAFAQEYASVWQ